MMQIHSLPIKAALFDMDGLIVDSEPFWKKAEKTVFSTLGLEVTEEDQLKTAMLSTEAVTEYWYRKQPWQIMSKLQSEQAVVEEVKALLSEESKAKPGFFDILQRCKTLNLHVGLASNAPYPVCATVLQKLQCLDQFDCVVSADMVARPKPEPDIYVHAANQLQVKPHDCLVFEDSPTGAKAAVAAGMKVIGVPSENHYVEVMKELVDELVFSLQDIQLQHFYR